MMCFQELVKDWVRCSFFVVDCSVWASGKSGNRAKMNILVSHMETLLVPGAKLPVFKSPSCHAHLPSGCVRHTETEGAFPVCHGQLTLSYLSFEKSTPCQKLWPCLCG